MKRIPILILTLITAAVAIADPPRRPSRQELLPPETLARFLDLAPGQIDQARAARETLRTTIQPLRDQQRALREQIKSAVDAGNATRAGELLIEQKALRTEINSAQQTFKRAFEAILTPTQKTRWDIYQEIAELRRGTHRGPRS